MKCAYCDTEGGESDYRCRSCGATITRKQRGDVRIKVPPPIIDAILHSLETDRRLVTMQDNVRGTQHLACMWRGRCYYLEVDDGA